MIPIEYTLVTIGGIGLLLEFETKADSLQK